MSLTIFGLLTSLVGVALANWGIPYTDADVSQVVGALFAVAGWVTAYYGRWRQGDVSFWGGKKY